MMKDWQMVALAIVTGAVTLVGLGVVVRQHSRSAAPVDLSTSYPKADTSTAQTLGGVGTSTSSALWQASSVASHDAALGYAVAQPTMMQISGAHGWLVKLHADGRLEKNPDVTFDEAAQAFWRAVEEFSPCRAKVEWVPEAPASPAPARPAEAVK